MTLEDLFASSELSNGLTAPARVEELVSIMQKEVCVVKNAGEITRQWSAVASTIAATENKECLELFIQLNGLCFINSWLKDAQKFLSDNSVEELITRLLVAVERLHVDYEKSVSSGIRVTVKCLLDHESSKVQERARVLFDIWEKEKDDDDAGEKVDTLIENENGQSEPSPENVGGKCEENVSMLSSRSGVGNSSDQHLKDGHHKSSPVGEDEPSTYDAEIIDTCTSAHGAQTGVPSINYSNHTQEDTSEEKTSSSDTDAGDAGSGSDLPRQTDIKDEVNCTPSDDASKTLMDDSRPTNHSRSSMVLGAKHRKYRLHNSSNDHSLERPNKQISDESVDDLENDTEPQTGSKDSEGDIELDYGIIDPLEVARQVALEVEREVEQSCSSSEKIQQSKIHEPHSPDSISAKVESSKKQGMSLLTEAEKVKLEGKDVDANAEKGLCDFDLNLEVCSDDLEDPIPTCISVVAASPGMPVAPLKFEGALGWKGSASTSAFRPASAKAVSSDSSKGWLDIDLNVADGGNDKFAEFFTKKSERVELDLNCASEEGDWRNGHWSRSPSSEHLSSHNFDLNDQPSFSSELSYLKKPSQNICASGGIKSGNSVVSIMGMKVEVKREDVPLSFPFANGRTAVDVNVGRSGGMGSPFLYAPSPAFGYNGIAPIPFSSAMYGPIPYMVGAPQIVGSASAIPPSFAQQPFIISMAGAPVSNGGSGLDLNTGDAGNRDIGGLRHFFTHGQVRTVDERSSQPSTSSLVGEKRKEPEGGWEPYPFKHHRK